LFRQPVPCLMPSSIGRSGLGGNICDASFGDGCAELGLERWSSKEWPNARHCLQCSSSLGKLGQVACRPTCVDFDFPPTRTLARLIANASSRRAVLFARVGRVLGPPGRQGRRAAHGHRAPKERSQVPAPRGHLRVGRTSASIDCRASDLALARPRPPPLGAAAGDFCAARRAPQAPCATQQAPPIHIPLSRSQCARVRGRQTSLSRHSGRT
jgi:hypothetical protein